MKKQERRRGKEAGETGIYIWTYPDGHRKRNHARPRLLTGVHPRGPA
jgi:hypothetical protein